MLIKLSPVRSDEQLILEVNGDLLLINGIAFDLAPLPDGAILPAKAIASPWIVGDVQRVNGGIEVTVLLPHAEGASDSALFPKPIAVNSCGLVELPR